MAKSLSSILSQIERLQKEAAAIQSDVISRIQKDIAKFGLTAEQLFGVAGAHKPGKAKSGTARAAKYADGAGNTWGGMGKRPDWLRQALEAGKALQDFLVAPLAAAAAPAKIVKRAKTPTTAAKRAPRAAKSTKAAATKAPAGKRAATKPAGRKPRAKPAPSTTGN